MMKKSSVLIALLSFGFAFHLAACRQAQRPALKVDSTPHIEPLLSVTSDTSISDLAPSDSSMAATFSPVMEDESTPKPPIKTEESQAIASDSLPDVTEPTPTATSQPPAQPPKTYNTSTEIPAPSKEPLSPPATSNEANSQRIIEQIREYGETKGFIWNDTLTFDSLGIGYYGRPNLSDDGVEGVIDTLKYHCDKIEREYGVCYFYTIQREFEGKTEFIVLYA